jgi:hypothetical protein
MGLITVACMRKVHLLQDVMKIHPICNRHNHSALESTAPIPIFNPIFQLITLQRTRKAARHLCDGACKPLVMLRCAPLRCGSGEIVETISIGKVLAYAIASEQFEI